MTSRDCVRHGKIRTALELAAVVAALEALLWGRGLVPGAYPIFGLSILVLTGLSHRRRGETAREIGFRADATWAAAVWLLPVLAIAAVLIIGVGAKLPGARPSPSAGVVLQFIASGVAQQYLLLGFFYRRVQELCSSVIVGVLLTATAFALLHLPNAFLTLVTFIAGTLSCVIYRKAPNLLFMGIVHGLIAALLYFGLPARITGSMQVGIEHVHSKATAAPMWRTVGLFVTEEIVVRNEGGRCASSL
jgi:membrane protease YdiL (CAAX protease family)